jgi:hypothetical protein
MRPAPRTLAGSTPTRTRAGRALAGLLAGLLAGAAALAGGCPGKDDDGGPRVLGTEGRERWVVTFEGDEPDLAEYRALLKDKPDDAEAYAEKMRKKLETDHEDLAKTLESLNGRIVERWWMSRAVTVEIDAGKAPSLVKAAGVKSLRPDAPLGP